MAVLEASIEKYLTDKIALRGGIAVKLNPGGYTGIPDRLVILPGFIGFVELKKPRNGVVAKMQKYWYQWLRQMGHSSEVLHTTETIDAYIKRVDLARKTNNLNTLGDTET